MPHTIRHRERKTKPAMRDGWVYFMRCDRIALIKIGWSQTPNERAMDVAAKFPYPLLIVTAQPGTIALEASLHHRFADLRERGEWFRDEPPLSEYVASVLAEHGKNPWPVKRSSFRARLAEWCDIEETNYRTGGSRNRRTVIPPWVLGDSGKSKWVKDHPSVAHLLDLPLIRREHPHRTASPSTPPL